MQQYLPLITGSGGALIVLAFVAWAFYAGKLHSHAEFTKLEEENDQLREAYARCQDAIATERKTVNETASTAQVTNQLITALTDIAAERSGRRRRARSAPDLTGEDLGL